MGQMAIYSDKQPMDQSAFRSNHAAVAQPGFMGPAIPFFAGICIDEL